jgi:hypothetical protein
LWSSRDHGAVRQRFQRQRWRRRARPADSAGLASPRKTDPRKRRPWAVKPEPKPRKGTPHERVTRTHSVATAECRSLVPCHDGKMPDEAMAAEREFNERNIDEFRRNGGKVGGEFEGSRCCC